MSKPNKYCQHVFESMLDHYYDAKARRSHASAIPIGTKVSAKYKPSKGVTLSDFIADFELSATKNMNPSEKQFFTRYYVNGYGVKGIKLTVEGKALSIAVKHKAGRGLWANKIYPMAGYLKNV